MKRRNYCLLILTFAGSLSLAGPILAQSDVGTFTTGAVYPGFANAKTFRSFVTVTNEPAVGDQLNVGGSLYTWTNAAAASPFILIVGSGSNSAQATNLYTSLTSSVPASVSAVAFQATNAVLMTGHLNQSLTVVASNDWATVTAASTNSTDAFATISLDAADKWIEVDNASTNRIWYTFSSTHTNQLENATAPTLEPVGDSSGNNYRLFTERHQTMYLLGENVLSNKVGYTKGSNRAQ